MVMMVLVRIQARPSNGVHPVTTGADVLKTLELVLTIRDRVMYLKVQVLVVIVQSCTRGLERMDQAPRTG